MYKSSRAALYFRRGDDVDTAKEILKTATQISVNRILFNSGVITIEQYRHADAVLQRKLTNLHEYDIIGCSEVI
jgi:hypothetical protein